MHSGKHKNTVNNTKGTNLSVQEIAARWSCHPLTVRRRIQRGEIKAHRFSATMIRVPLLEVERYESQALA